MTQTSDRRDESLSLEYQACRDVMDNYEMAEPGEMNVVRFTGYAMMDSWRAGYDRGIAAERARSKVLVEAMEEVTETESVKGWDMQDIADKAIKKYNKLAGGGE